MIYEFIMPTRIIHGPGCAGSVGAEVRAFGCSNALVVTDRGVEKAGLLASILESLSSANIEYAVFAEIPEDATPDAIHRALDEQVRGDLQCVVGVGGGSPLCAGKAVAMLATNGGSVQDYYGPGKVRAPSLPNIAVPTTAGSGTEVSRGLVVFDPDLKALVPVVSPYVFPPLAILDPLLLQTLPFRQAAISGVDALVHAIEAYSTDLATPITDALSLEAIRLLATSLVRSAGTGDLEAKNQNMLASMMANISCGNARLGLVHGLAEPVSGWFRLPHGVSNGIVLPRVMEYNLPVAVPRLANIALALGEKPDGRSQRELAEAAVTATKRLLADLDFERCFTDPPVDRSSIPQIAAVAAHGMYEPTRPTAADVPINTLITSANIRRATVRDAIAIYERCFEPWSV